MTAKSGNRYLIFDPTDERSPVGNLSSGLQGSYGTLAAGEDSQVIQLPILPPEANGTDRKGTFTLAGDGTLTGTVDSFHTGPEGADLRTALKYSNDRERREAFETILSPTLTADSVKPHLRLAQLFMADFAAVLFLVQ